MLAADNGGSLAGAYGSNDVALDALCEKMRCTKVCHTGDAQTCGHSKDWTTLNGGAAWQDYSWNNATADLADGMILAINAWVPACNSTRYSNITCGAAMIDVNGFKKPNKYGRDMFEIFIDVNGRIIPQGSQGTDMETFLTSACDPSGSGTYNGATCGARIMLEGGMKY